MKSVDRMLMVKKRVVNVSLKFLFEYLRSHNQDATTLWKDIQVREKSLKKKNENFLFFSSSLKRIL